MRTHQNLKPLSAKKLVRRLKRQDTDWEKIFAPHISNKGLVSRIYKRSQNSTTKIQLGDGQML